MRFIKLFANRLHTVKKSALFLDGGIKQGHQMAASNHDDVTESQGCGRENGEAGLRMPQRAIRWRGAEGTGLKQRREVRRMDASDRHLVV